jgi:hypothetical protein
MPRGVNNNYKSLGRDGTPARYCTIDIALQQIDFFDTHWQAKRFAKKMYDNSGEKIIIAKELGYIGKDV